MKRRSALGKDLFLFYIGFTNYLAVELLYRGRSHWSMGILGGICFLIVGGLNARCGWEFDLALQMLLSAGIITVLEFLTGYLLNVRLGLGIWDYSRLPYQLMGQISLYYSLLWVPLSLVGIMLDDWLRYFLFREEKPHYLFFGIKLGDWACCNEKLKK